MTRRRRPTVVVIGAGFGGIAAVRGLRRVDADVILLDRHNYHLFQPLLYQVASALLDPSEIAHPVRSMLRRIGNARFRLANVTSVDLDARVVHTDAGDHAYDWLVVAAGAETNFFGNANAAAHAFELKDLDGALALRNHVLSVFERAVETGDATERQRLLTFAVIGGGPTGVEFAGALAELVRSVLRKDFPDLDISTVRIELVEASPHLLGPFAPRLRAAAARTLEHRGVRLRLGRGVRDVDVSGRLTLDDGSEVDAATVVWTAGVHATSLTAHVGSAAGPVATGSSRRIRVDRTLRLPEHPEVLVIGDMAECADVRGRPLPMLAPVAIQQGAHAAATIAAALAGEPAPLFRYRDRGTMATIGRNAAVAQLGPVQLSGFPGWVMWLVVHLVQIVSFRSRLVVLVNWAGNYLWLDRPVRLITAPSPTLGNAAVTPEEHARSSG